MKIFNSLTDTKETFTPIVPPHVRMYVCGVTVYDDCHLGHARSAVVFDVICRYLQSQGYHVTLVKNFTDIDDKILDRANREATSWTKIVEKYVQAYYRDMGRLGIGQPQVEPRATDHIQTIVEMIQGLVDRGYAYSVDGDVYYRVGRFDRYGRLSRRNLDDMLAGARVDIDQRKHDPMDFVLWKKSKAGEPAWKSPWSEGRPGWHIECSAMAIYHLGETFDIHGGGKDLMFPHHENEIAQACAYTGKEFARFWVHNGFVTIDKEKMSKSLGNFFTVWELFAQSNCSECVTAETLRYFLLSTHYRNDLNFSTQAVIEAKSSLDSLYGLFHQLAEPGGAARFPQNYDDVLRTVDRAFTDAMDDDFNTPKAMAAFHLLRGTVNKWLAQGLSTAARNAIRNTFRHMGAILGIFQVSCSEWEFRAIDFGLDVSEDQSSQHVSDEWIHAHIQRRAEARERKDFETSDQIRKELAEWGITVEDRPDGTSRWKR